MNLNSDIKLIPEKYQALSLDNLEIVLPYPEVIEVINYFEKNNIALLGWEGWAKYPENKKSHFGDFQGTTSFNENLGQSWNEYVKSSNEFSRDIIKKRISEMERKLCFKSRIVFLFISRNSRIKYLSSFIIKSLFKK